MINKNNIPKKSKIGVTNNFKISRIKRKIKASNPHKHDAYHELIYLTEGAGFHTIDLTSYQIETPSLFLVNAGEVHYWEFTKIPDGYVAIFKSDFLAHLSYKNTYSKFDQTDKRYFRIRDEHRFPFSSLFELIKNEYEQDKEGSTRIIASSLELIFTQMGRLTKRNQSKETHPKEKTYRTFRKLLDEHLFDYHLVKKYADLLNITPKHLNEITKERTQKTPSELIAEKRILEAQRQLLYSSQTISEIAHQLGFSSPSHFGTFFKKNVGFTPDQYRTEKVTDI